METIDLEKFGSSYPQNSQLTVVTVGETPLHDISPLLRAVNKESVQRQRNAKSTACTVTCLRPEHFDFILRRVVSLTPTVGALVLRIPHTTSKKKFFSTLNKREMLI